MDIEKLLLDEHSKKQTMRIVNYVGDDRQRFKQLMKIFLEGEYRVTQRAAWPLSYAARAHPQLIKPYFKKLIAKLEETGHHPSIPRNILRIFEAIEIPEAHHGRLVDLCLKFIHDARLPAGIRAFALSTAANICKLYPELKSELTMMLDEMEKYPQQPAIRSRIKSARRTLLSK
jgi:hypothetical protein